MPRPAIPKRPFHRNTDLSDRVFAQLPVPGGLIDKAEAGSAKLRKGIKTSLSSVYDKISRVGEESLGDYVKRANKPPKDSEADLDKRLSGK